MSNIKKLNLPKNNKGLIPYNEKCLKICLEEMSGMPNLFIENANQNENIRDEKERQNLINERSEIIKELNKLNKISTNNQNKLYDLNEKYEDLENKINDKRTSKINLKKYQTQYKAVSKQIEKAYEKSFIIDVEIEEIINKKNEYDIKIKTHRNKPRYIEKKIIHNYSSDLLKINSALSDRIEIFSLDLIWFDINLINELIYNNKLIEVIKNKVHEFGSVNFYFDVIMIFFKHDFFENNEYIYVVNKDRKEGEEKILKIVENLDDINKCLNQEINFVRVHTKKFEIVNDDEDLIKNILSQASFDLTTNYEKINNKIGSSYYFKFISSIEMSIYEKKNLKGSSYIELPEIIKNKKCCINVQNKNDNKCFMWSILSAIYPAKKDADRTSKYIEYMEELNFKDIEFPMKLKDIPKFEKQNEISINVYSYNIKINDDEKEIMEPYVMYKHSKKYEKLVNLLYFENGENEDFNSHYCWIKNFSAFMSDSSTRNQYFYCFSCLQRFTTQDKLNDHEKYCGDYDAVKTTMPDDDHKNLCFDKIHHIHDFPYKIFADFECITEKINLELENSKHYQVHNISGYTMILYCALNNDFKINNFTGKGAFEEFMKNLFKFRHYVDEKYQFKNQKQIIMTEEDKKNYNDAEECYLCNKPFIFGDKKNNKVKDHCHITGKYRGAAHNICNLKYRVPRELPIIFHNLKGYDSHIIFNNIGEYISTHKNLEFSVIPNNTEKYLSFSINKKIEIIEGKKIYDNLKLKFMDSFAFLTSSIDTLSKNLSFDNKNVTYNYFLNKYYGEENLKNEFPYWWFDDYFIFDYFGLINRKGIFPYDWYDSLDKLNNLSLPEINDFYSKLNLSNIEDKEYLHAITVWNTFDCKTFKDYHDLYMNVDVLLLADIWTNFEIMCKNYYGLNPCHYFSLPGMAFEACLKKSGVNLSLTQDPNIYMMNEKGIRGGMSTIFKKYATANNKYMENYDPKKESSYIMYVDANNLYGWAMVQKLPIEGGKFVNIDNWNIEKIMNYDFENSDIGYNFEVDIHYPENLHDLHNDYPLAPEQYCAEDEKLSKYQKYILDKNNSKRTKTKKLIGHFNDHKNYVVHGRILQFYIKHGLEITKIHKVIEYKQASWMKDYIDFNTQKRAQSKNDFEKDFFKLCNNAPFGKTMEDVRHHIDFEIVSDEKRFLRLSKSNRIKGIHIFNPDLVGIDKIKKNVYLNKPIFVGQAILDLSKLHMFKYYYEYLKPKYGKNMSNLMTDTDSLVLHIKCNDFYKDMKDDGFYYDMSEMKNKDFQDNKNKKVLGKFKDEANGKPISEFIGLRAKMYSYIIDNDKNEHKKCKGIKKCNVSKNINHNMYKDALFNAKIYYEKQCLIKSEKHVLTSIEQNKISLSSFDDKRYTLSDSITTMTFGHYKIKNL